jgi:hypothetical protein
MLVRKNRLAVTPDSKQRTVGFPDEFAAKVALVLSQEKQTVNCNVAQGTAPLLADAPKSMSSSKQD